MHIVIVGGGKVGFHLARLTQANAHSVVLIERDRRKSQLLAENLNTMVLCGDGSRLDILEEAETGRANVFVAVTGSDEDNIIACQLAKKVFGVSRTIARINNPKNEQLVHELGVDVGVSSTGIIGNLIEQEVLADELRTLLTFQRGDMVLVQFRVQARCPLAAKAIVDIAPQLPENTLFVAVLRDGETVVPKGQTLLLPGDEVVAMTQTGFASELEAMFMGR